MIDLVRDLKDILIKLDDKEHDLQIIVDGYAIYVKLIYRYDDIMVDKKTILSVCLDISMGIVYIPDDMYRKEYLVDEYGIDAHEIRLCEAIMEYLENNVREIEILTKEMDKDFRFDGK